VGKLRRRKAFKFVEGLYRRFCVKKILKEGGETIKIS
jgi:hypothetical protein